MPYGYDAGYTPHDDCVFCPGNYLLDFEPITIPEKHQASLVKRVGGYVLPGTRPITGPEGQVEPVPFPSSALIVTPYHNNVAAPPGARFADDWQYSLNRLMPLVDGLPADKPLNTATNYGGASGNRVGSHPFVWLLWDRDHYAETPATASLGLMSIVHASRQAAGSLPSDEEMLKAWRQFQIGRPHKHALAAYNKWLAKRR